MSANMPDQIIDAAMARSIQADTVNKHVLAGWIILHDPPEYLDPNRADRL